MTLSLSDAQARYLRLRAQRLAAPELETVAGLVRAVAGLQAQEMPAAALGVRARSVGLVATQVEQARLVERSVVRTWGMRGTIHLLAAEDLGWLLPLLAPGCIATSRRRSAELGLDEETYARALRVIRDALASQGPLTRPELVEYLDARGIRTEGQAKAYLVYRAALEGVICFGPERGAKPTFVLLDDWVKCERKASLSREDASAELARRYLAAYGPARPEDLAAWSGLAISEARAAWGRISDELREVAVAQRPAWLLKSQIGWLDAFAVSASSVRLLPAFDTYLLGYRSRDLAVAPQYARRVNAGGGMIRPVLLVDGQVVGTWTNQRQRGGLAVSVEPFQPLDPGIQPGLEAEVEDLGRFLGTFARVQVLPPLAQ